MKLRTLLDLVVLILLISTTTLFCMFGKANQFGHSKIISKIVGFVASSENLTEHEGDIIIDLTETYVLANCTFVQKGNIIVKGNATLRIENADLTIQQDFSNQYRITIDDSAAMFVSSCSEVRSNFDLYLYSFGQSTIEIKDSKIRAPIMTEFSGVSNVNIRNSTVDTVRVGLLANISITGSSIGQIFNCCPPKPTISVSSSTVNDISMAYDSEITIVNSQVVSTLLCFDNASAYLVSSRWNTINAQAGTIIVLWCLNVTVNLNMHPIQGATVEVFYQHNGSLGGTETTGVEGKVRFALAEKILNSTGSYTVGNYLVKASYMNTSDQTNVTLKKDEKTEISLVDVVKPTINDVICIPRTPTARQNVTVTAIVFDHETEVSNVTLKRSIDNGTTWESIPMHHEVNSTYVATFPNSDVGTITQFYLLAYDGAGNYAETSLYSYTIPPNPMWQTYVYVLLIAGLIVTCVYALGRRRKTRTKLNLYLRGIRRSHNNE